MRLNRVIAGLALGGLAMGAADAALKNIMIYSMTAGFRHGGAITDGNALIDTLGKKNGFTVYKTEDPNYMTYANMKKYDVLVFNNTTGPVLPTATQQADFIKYLTEGGGWVGFHGAMDSHGYWQWYTDQGVDFAGHTPGQANCRFDSSKAPMKPEYKDIVNIFTATNNVWEWDEEWYAFKENPRRNSDILITVDESSPKWNLTDPTQKMGDHAVAWAKQYPALPGSTKHGHYFYTSLGHGQGGIFKTEKYVNDLVYQAIRWAAGEMDTSTVSGKITGRIPPTGISESRVLPEIHTRAISALPNQIDVAVQETGFHKVEILNMRGQTVRTLTGGNSTSYAIPGMSQGIYMVRISAARHVQNFRVLVQ